MTNDEIMKIVESIPHSKWDIVRFADIIRNAALEEACAAIKAEDDRAAAKDYMLDSDDCIEVIRALKTKEQSYCDIHCKQMCQNSVHGMCDGPPNG